MSIRQSEKIFLAAMYLAAILLGMETGGFQYIVLKVSEHYGLSQAAMGSLISLHFIAVVVIPPIFGSVSDRVGKRKVTYLFCGVFLLGAAVCCLSSTVSGFSIGIFCAGGAFGTLVTTCQSALSDSYPGEAGKATSRFQGALGAGCVLSPLLISFTMEALHCSWRILFVICGSGFLTITLMLPMCLYPEGSSVTKTSTGSRSKSIFSRTLAGVLAGIFMYMFIETVFTYFLDSFFVKVLDASGLSAPALSAFWAMIAVTRLAAGRLYRYHRIILPLALVFSVIMILLMGRAADPRIAVLLSVTPGIAFAPVWPFLLGLATDRYSERAGFVTGLVMLMDGCGAAIAPVVVGLVSDAIGLQTAFSMLSVVGAASIISYIVFLK